ncbi:hypothetical protein F4808DRAFT_436078 [Astrocystis sublimbata]|nr:hypothetical protein F4808DRAFT_436078 [Astrocystis sublimbata]
MRPSTVFGIFAVSAHAAVLPQVQRYGALTGLTGITGLTSGLTSSLGGLGGLGSLGGLSSLGTSVVGTVGDLLRVPFDLLGPLLGVSVLPCNIDERLCVATCTPNCSGNAQAVSLHDDVLSLSFHDRVADA